MSYDPKCYELADLFLQDEVYSRRDRAKLAHELAQGIQSYIGGWIEGFRDALQETLDARGSCQ